MSFTVKDIINDAYDRTGIFPNPSDALPGEMFELGLKLLRGLVHFYNIKNYITCTQRMVTVKVPSDCTVKMAKTDEGVTPKIENVAGVSMVYLKQGGSNMELKYTAFMNFPKYSSTSPVYTWNDAGEYAFDVMFQPWLKGREVIIMYNVPFDCDKNTVYYLSPEYKELFTLGLCLKLLSANPREDNKMYEQMADELKALTNAIEAKQSDAKIIEWNVHSYIGRRAAFESGEFLFGGND